MTDPSPAPTGQTRLPLIDALRGAAVAAMVVYHLSWDLSYHHLVAWDVVGDPLWRGFAIAIATSFLTLSGISLVLAERQGKVPGRAFMVRILKIAAAAALVSLATLIVFPDGWIRFGILHMIALGSLLALPFLRLSFVVTIAAAAVVLAVGLTVADPAFDHPLLVFTGLSAWVPPSNDFVPVFPWFAAMLAGISIGQALPRRTPQADGRVAGGTGRMLAAVGRYSLPIYLVHQPVLFALTGAVAAALPANEAVERASFERACRLECGRTGDVTACARFCGCVAGSLDGTGFWQVKGGDPELQSLVATAVGACRGAMEPPPP